MTRASRYSSPLVCRHLGLANDPFHHLDGPSEEHRCYLWMQRDQVDLGHQGTYCLSSLYRDCPWLQISLPCQPGIKTIWRERLTPTLSDTGRTVGLALAAFLALAATRGGAWLRAAALWTRANLPRAMAWLWRELSPAARVAAERLRHACLRLARSIFRPRPRQRPKAIPDEALQSGDFSLLMRLGREANRVGHRKQAHFCFSRAAALDPASEEVWLWMAATAEGSEEALTCLERALVINPASGRGQAQLAGLPRPAAPGRRGQAEATTVGISVPRLLEEGIKAINEGDEDKAYKFFAAATEADAANAAAWFWRAKTATDLAEVINCLERVLELDPDNQKAQASLSWAQDRQRMEGERQRLVSSHHSAPVTRSFYSEPKPLPRSPLLHFASLAYLFLGLLWTVAVAFQFLDEAQASFYREVMVLPVLKMGYLSPSVLGLPDGLVPEFNLLYLAPSFVAVVCFIAMETLWDDRRPVSFYVALVSGASMVATSLFVAGHVASVVVLATSVVAGASALAGRAIYQHRLRAQPSPSSRAATGTSGVASSGAGVAPGLVEKERRPA